MTDPILSIEDRLNNYLEPQAEEAPAETDQTEQDTEVDDVEPTEIEVQEQSDEDLETPEEAETEDEATDEDGEFLTIKHNGEEKKLTKAEVIALSQKGYDYDVKTAKLAEQRRETEAEVQRINATRAKVDEEQKHYMEQLRVVAAFNSEPVYSDEELQRILQDHGPAAYLGADNQNKQRAKVLDAVRAQISQEQEATNQRYAQEREQNMETERNKLREAMPDLMTSENTARLASYLMKEYGYDAETISNTGDHRLFTMAEKARRYDDMKAKQAERKPVVTLPKVNKPVKGRQDAGSINAQERHKAFAKVKQSGKVDDAAAAIARLNL